MSTSSTPGHCAWLRVRGYISTARKHGINVMTAIRDAVAGNRASTRVHASVS